jgi:hypothetical protein
MQGIHLSGLSLGNASLITTAELGKSAARLGGHGENPEDHLTTTRISTCYGKAWEQESTSLVFYAPINGGHKGPDDPAVHSVEAPVRARPAPCLEAVPGIRGEAAHDSCGWRRWRRHNKAKLLALAIRCSRFSQGGLTPVSPGELVYS